MITIGSVSAGRASRVSIATINYTDLLMAPTPAPWDAVPDHETYFVLVTGANR